MPVPRCKKWTAMVLTCTHMDASYAYQRELEIRQEKGYIDKDVILLTAEDPKSQVGSGGATLNALLLVAEYISAKQGYSVVNPDVLLDAHIVIIHAGRKYPYDPCGRPFLTFPAKPKQPEYDCLISHVDVLIKLLTEKIAVNSPPGIWVCSTEMLITLPDNTVIEWEPCDVYAVTIPQDKETCRSHGIYKLDSEGFVEDILYQASMNAIDDCVLPSGKVPVLCGIVYFSCAVSQRLLSFHVTPPLDACTYMGVDSGSPPLPLSFFFDVMLPMASGVNEEAFVSGDRSGAFGMAGSYEASGSSGLEIDRSVMKVARKLLWKNLSDIKIKSCILEGSYHFLGSRGSDHHEYQLNCPLQTMKDLNLVFKNKTHSYIQPSCKVSDSCVVVNSILTGGVITKPNTAISHSCIEGQVSLGKDSLYCGVKLDNAKSLHPVTFADSVVVQGFFIHLKTLGTSQHVLTVHGRFDRLHASVYDDPGTFCNEPWEDFLRRTGIVKEDLWDSKLEKDQTITAAKLFPVFHATENVGLKECLWLQGEAGNGATLKRWRSSWRISFADIMSYGDIVEEFEERRRLFYEISKHEIENTLLHGLDNGFCCVYNSARVEGASSNILETLDKIALSSDSPGIVARVLGNIADVLGSMAGHKGGLRSGPASNLSWAKPFVLLEKGEIAHGIKQMAKVRNNWLGRPDLLIRAARHYEGAAQILIRQAVMTGRQFFPITPMTMPPVNKWVTVECPARIDLAGGWSDTPPICYEHGGAVTNMALLIEGKRPIGARARRIPEPCLVLVIRGENNDASRVTIKLLSDLKDYNQPHSQGALLKAAFICANIVEYPSPFSLDEQLSKTGGFELESWSDLPRGSGLGTSSILAGAIMCALLKASGQTTDVDGLNHAVLHLEQMLTTGGGWQDQIGGLVPGVKIGISQGKLPVKIETKPLKVSPETIKAINDRMVLVFTGRPRLARNLLQDVVRNWYSRTPEIVETEDNLVHVAWECAKALEEGDFEKMGVLLDKYWALKSRMAVGSEPVPCTRMMNAIRPYAYGMVLAGAGGGGFLFVMMKSPKNPKGKVQELLDTVQGGEDAVIYDACIDETGMIVTVED